VGYVDDMEVKRYNLDMGNSYSSQDDSTGNVFNEVMTRYLQASLNKNNNSTSVFGLDLENPNNILRADDHRPQINQKRPKCPICMKLLPANKMNEANRHVEECLLKSNSEVLQKSNFLSESRNLCPNPEISNLNLSHPPRSFNQINSPQVLHQSLHLSHPNHAAFQEVIENEDSVKQPESFKKLMEFKRKVQDLKINFTEGYVLFNISRTELLMDSVEQVQKLDSEDLRSEFQVHFVGEPAMDAGGLTKEWLNLVAKEILTCNLGLFKPTNTEDRRFWISQNADVTVFYEVLGKIIGKAILNNLPINCPLSYTLLKSILGQKNEKEDVKFLDKDLYKIMKFIENNSIEGVLFETFSILDNGEIYEFFEGGSKVELNDLNKEVYVNLRVDYELNSAVETSVENLKKGINSVIPLNFFQDLSVDDLDLLICGSPVINLKEWKKFSVYQGDFHEDHQVIRWFWECLEKMEQEDLRLLLTFVTGAGRVPIEGFEQLRTHRGDPARFTLESAVFFLGALPRAHTCFNRLDLPLYRDKETLRKSLDHVIKNHRHGFDFE
jgi:hypothetical protein